ncbi:MAG: hypothetical protein ABEK36_01490 [Candidatus Aenigmatarchaeota archaeon]
MRESYKQWLNCKHSVEANGSGEMVYELKNWGLSEVYGCQHPEIVKSDDFKTEELSDGGVIAVFKEFLIPGELDREYADQLLRKRNERLEICKNCDHYERMEDYRHN